LPRGTTSPSEIRVFVEAWLTTWIRVVDVRAFGGCQVASPISWTEVLCVFSSSQVWCVFSMCRRRAIMGGSRSTF